MLLVDVKDITQHKKYLIPKDSYSTENEDKTGNSVILFKITAFNLLLYRFIILANLKANLNL